MRRGLKRTRSPFAHERLVQRFKPIPDEEGTETSLSGTVMRDCYRSFKPIPDEEGTETRPACEHRRIGYALASNRSPMRRGLKRACLPAMQVGPSGFKPIPDEEGTETRAHAGRILHGNFERFKPIPDEEGTETSCS